MYSSAFFKFNLLKYRVVKSGLSSKFKFGNIHLILLFILGVLGMRYQFPHEYTKPLILTDFPGPKHLEALENTNGDAESLEGAQRFINFRKSYGSYAVDIDGNRFLDLNASASGVVLGYNN
jgi:hypothetical protein